jgi:nucleotide-binding universal stress UspA family protein
MVVKILLAIDGSSYSDAAVKEVAGRPWPSGTEVKAICAVEPAFIPATEPWAVPPTFFGEIEKAAQERANRAVTDAGAQLGENGSRLTVTTATPVGWAKQVILDEADAWRADLIVMGSHGYGAWERFLLGSVSTTVATHAGCSVEIVRGRTVPVDSKRIGSE